MFLHYFHRRKQTEIVCCRHLFRSLITSTFDIWLSVLKKGLKAKHNYCRDADTELDFKNSCSSLVYFLTDLHNLIYRSIHNAVKEYIVLFYFWVVDSFTHKVPD